MLAVFTGIPKGGQLIYSTFPMLFDRTDKLFEDAGRSPEARDKLLERLQRTRAGLLTTLVISLLAVLAVAVWLVMQINAFVRSGSMNSPLLRYLTSLDPVGVSIIFVSSFIGVCIRVASVDTCIKNLLMMRASREVLTSKLPDDQSV